MSLLSVHSALPPSSPATTGVAIAGRCRKTGIWPVKFLLSALCDNLRLRTRIKRLARRTICFLRSVKLHAKIVGTFTDNTCSIDWMPYLLRSQGRLIGGSVQGERTLRANSDKVTGKTPGRHPVGA
ncbi:hypothetical protein EHW66_00295 [Erwinia psidii]|nr:hypothetical protein [Erwinia psidii]MCX8959961.1 hypothetical protein [Erwinia psidii]MCX8963507.1 hypothetical protein [Erwinia psidii]